MERDFLSMVPIQKLFFDPTFLCEQGQEKLLQATIQSPLALSYPPSLLYQQKFLKKLISKVEEQGGHFGLNEDLILHYNKLLSQLASDITPQQTCFKTFIFTDEIYITIKEDQYKITQGTTGLRLWGASLRLIWHLLQDSAFVRHKNVLELGSGTGLLGLSCMLMGAASVLLTDCNQLVLQRLEENVSIFTAQHMNMKSKVLIQELDWEKPFRLNIQEFVCIASDVIYHPELFKRLLNTIKHLFTQYKCEECWIAGCVRDEATFRMFIQESQQELEGYLDVDVKSIRGKCPIYTDENDLDLKLILIKRLSTR